MLDNVITWLMKRLILLWDRHNDKLAFSFCRDERTDYSVLVERFYDDYYTVGTAMYPYNKGQENFCPLADRMMEKHGTLVGVDCEREWEKWREEPPKEET